MPAEPPRKASEGDPRIPTWLSWSSGKDSAWSLHRLAASPTHRVVGLLTTITDRFARVSMHGVREELLRAQARAVGLPVHEVRIPFPCPNETYERRMGTVVAQARSEGVGAMAFGDLFLEDIRKYRESRLEGTGIAPVFPLWGLDTRALAEAMIDGGQKARLVCVDPRKLDARFAGREFDRRLLGELPEGVDPCGERGEFHTFVYASPAFARPVPVRNGDVVERDGFVFADAIPG